MINIKRILIFILIFINIPLINYNISIFLEEDNTDKNEYFPWYTCGHFSRDLARNASEHNITMGSVILSNHPRFSGKYNNHIMNYIMINNTIMLIDPQTDEIYTLNSRILYNNKILKYYRLYPNGTQVPTYWNCNLAYTGIIR